MTTTKPLTPKRQRLVDRYVSNGFNGAEAYRYAGYAVNGPSVARTEATRILAIPSVAKAVERKIAHLQAQSDLSATDIIAGLHDIAVDDSQPTPSRVSAWSKLADILGLVTRKVQHLDDRETVRAELARLFTFDELLAMREQLALSEPTAAVDVTDIEDDV